MGRNQLQPAALGSVLFVLGAASGLAAIAFLRRDCRALIAAIRAMTETGKVAPLQTENAELRPLVRAANELVEASDKLVSDAALRVKELEIQLKVATAERQHAEAIIYSISDAVLVTDPFDELVLANESAARTFEFDLAQAGRSPVDRRAARPEADRADPRDAAEQQPQRAADRRAHGQGGRRRPADDVQGHALRRVAGPARDEPPAGRRRRPARHDAREGSRGDEERLRLQRQPRAAHAAGQHQGVRRDADRRRGRRREDHRASSTRSSRTRPTASAG